MPAQIIKVSQLNRYVRAQLEENTLLGDLLVKGELTSVSWRRSSGHFYFTISEGGASLHCVMFARYAERLPSFPEEGSTVIVRGAVTLYERDGQYQLSAYDIQNMGQGSGSADYTALRQKLLAEGLLSQSANAKHFSFRGPLALLPLQKAPLCRISSPGCSDIMI